MTLRSKHPSVIIRPHGRTKLAMGLQMICATVCLAGMNTVMATEGLDARSQNFLRNHCVHCHDESTQEGDFRLDNLEADFANPLLAQKWSEVVFRVNAGEMPPPTETTPSSDEIGLFAETVTRKIREGAAARMARRGPVQHYRLSREEYAHTVYDLLAVVFDVEAPGAFNEDPRWHGFNRVGALLSVAPSHINRYFDAADAVIARAFPDTETSSKKERKLAGEGQRRLLQLGEGYEFNISEPGRYRIRVRASGLPAFSGRLPHLTLWHRHHKRSFGGADLRAEEEAPQTLEFEGLFPTGTYEVRNHARKIKHANGSIQFFRNENIDASVPIASLFGRERSPWTKVIDEQGKPTVPLLLVDWVEIEGPYLTELDHKKREGVFPTDENDATARRHCLQRFAERAWRRPVTTAEIEPYVQLISNEQEAGEDFRTAYRSALASILVSRRFFHLEEGTPSENRLLLNNFELASRLSYFLWSSMPDEQLFEAARNGSLSTSEGLSHELDRMLTDPKINRFLDSFPKQWLQLHRVGMFQPDPGLYPEYDPWLEESMVHETTAYFSEMFRNDLPIREAIDSNWSILNQRLAAHYGLPQPDLLNFNRFEFAPETGRGGILTHASILSLTSDGTRHRPVHRGAWVSEAILASTPPPPPPNVDPIEPVVGDEPKTTIRSKLEAHATSPNCISCHAKIDPLGLAFENFDAIGRWRDVERVEGGVGEHPPVDASGKFSDGRTFTGPIDFKQLLADDESALADAFLEQLATYALRRVTTIDDAEPLKSIAASTEQNEYGVRSMIRQLVLSELFRTR